MEDCAYCYYCRLFAEKVVLNPHIGLKVDSSQLTLLPTSKSYDTKTRTSIKNPAGTKLEEEIALGNGRISNSQGLVTLILIWIRSYYIPSRISHRPLPTCPISLKSYGQTYVTVRTDVHMYGHLRPALLGRL